MLADSDAGLNRVYSQLITALRRRDGASTAADPASVRQLRSEERAWIVRRDEACRQRGRGREGALWAPSRAKCLGTMSAQRSRELENRLRRVQGR